MSKFEIIFTAVMATIIIHLTVAVIFVSVKISAMKREMAAEIILTFEETPDQELQKALDLAKNDQFQGATAEDMVNAIKNIADKPMDIDPKEYEDMVKEELIKNGIINDNKPSEKPEEEDGADEIPIPDKEIKPELSPEKKKQEEKGTFRGPTRIYYDLAGRHHVYLPVPIYKCEGAGQITMAIIVDRSGNVIKAESATKLSTTKDPCLLETALTYALKSRFNTDQNAPEKQAGFLTFVFVSQN